VSVPIVKLFSAENVVPPKPVPKMAGFFHENGSITIDFGFKTPKGTSLRGTASFDVFYVKISATASAVASLKNQKQEGWLSLERVSVSVISLRHNLATSRESRRYVVAITHFAGGSIWLRQESLRHTL